MMTNLRIRNTYNEDGGAWINADTAQLAYARKLLADLRRDEPEVGWRLETRGTATQWHTYDLAADQLPDGTDAGAKRGSVDTTNRLDVSSRLPSLPTAT